MGKNQLSWMTVILCVAFLSALFFVKMYSSAGVKEIIFRPETGERTSGRWEDIADMFLPFGQKYNEKEGVIYNCFGTGRYKSVKSPPVVRDFYVGAQIEKELEDANKRKEKMSQNFGKPNLKKEKGFQTSGHGSTMEAAQAPLALLNSLIDRLKIHLNKPVITMVDIPCGDFFWMRELVKRRPDLDYTGYDIVPAIIERHRVDYKNIPNARFVNADIVLTALNQSYDIVFSRDMLQHLSNADALKALKHFSDSGSKLLVTTNLNAEETKDLGAGRYRHLNLMLPPINLVPPICLMEDRVSNNFKDIGVWKLPLKQQL